MKRRNWLGLMVMVGPFLVSGIQGGYAMSSRPAGLGVVVTSGLIHGTQPKYGVEIKSDSGPRRPPKVLHLWPPKLPHLARGDLMR